MLSLFEKWLLGGQILGFAWLGITARDRPFSLGCALSALWVLSPELVQELCQFTPWVSIFAVMERYLMQLEGFLQFHKCSGLPHEWQSKIFHREVSPMTDAKLDKFTYDFVELISCLYSSKKYSSESWYAIWILIGPDYGRIPAVSSLDEPCTRACTAWWREIYINILWGSYKLLYKFDMIWIEQVIQRRPRICGSGFAAFLRTQIVSPDQAGTKWAIPLFLSCVSKLHQRNYLEI